MRRLTLGITRHSNSCFLVVLPQVAVGNLQVLLQEEEGHDSNNNKSSGVWVDVPAVEEAVVLNVVDFLQLVSNDKFKSVEHRVVSQPRRRASRLRGLLLPEAWQPRPRVLAPIVADGEARTGARRWRS
ncbi:hypothetical protein ZWY2020_042015 [Hordeum vulgare]|nr:hypothetical protein ZWY2020_042015 [Hordeum vulgare]